MSDIVSRLDLYALGRDYLLQRAKKIDPSQVDVLGSDSNIFVGSNSVVADVIIRQLGYSIARLTLDGAERDDLDRYAFDRYTLTRKGASAALGQVTITRPTFAAGPGNVPTGTKLTTVFGSEYVTTSLAAFGSSDLISKANVRAVQAGFATQVGANTITKFSQPGNLFDKTFQVTNPEPTSGGADVEDDDTFKARIRNFWRTARRGILAAIEFGAIQVPGVFSAQATEVLSTNALPARSVVLYISDSSGVSNLQLATVVNTQLLDFRAGGIAVIIVSSIPQLVSIQLKLTYQASVDTVSLFNLVQAAVVNFVNSLPVNGPLYLAQLQTVISRFTSNGVVPAQSNIVSPVGDIIPAIGQTLRTRPELVTGT